MRLASASALQNLHRPWPSRIARTLAVALVLAFPAALLAQDAPRPELESKGASATQDFGRLFDAVVETTAKNFWDKERLAAIGWDKRAAEVRQSVVARRRASGSREPHQCTARRAQDLPHRAAHA